MASGGLNLVYAIRVLCNRSAMSASTGGSGVERWNKVLHLVGRLLILGDNYPAFRAHSINGGEYAFHRITEQWR